MHQNLKTTFCLNLENQWQTITASKAYGTFYTLHVKFKYKTGTKIPENCQLYIQNFSGIITLGIHEIHNEIKLIHDPIMGKPSYVMYIYLKALYANEKICDQKLNFINEISTHQSIKEFSNDTDLKIEVLFKKVDGFDEHNLSMSTIVDHGFKRDGESLLKETLSAPLNERRTLTEIYKEYFGIAENEDIQINGQIAKNIESIKTNQHRALLEETTDIVTLPNDEKHTVVKPYPCYLSYVQFV